ncbi:nitrilase family protein [Flavitalea sp. BT771]|uniref:nitrilase family protein n=1 Tax=Flavitalea sp. BT771 TaxID=3063329 RepID=UPI0026E1FC31|nr:nitrilase family protein [Flavitalea sp. BT771]MDO6433365.1 nitrilase family protein [Flavitalea sp. BT771]MDV6222730.1 nitrilase family protein [Flavitalea sp. BT771]
MPPLTITLIQPDLRWEDKAANLARFGAQIDAISEKTHLVILPEMFSTGFSMRPEALAEPMSGPTVAWMSQTAARKKVILTGSLIIEEKGRYYNRLIWMLPNGQYGIYDKRHRFAYAGEHEHYTAGHKRLIASVNGWKVNLLVCYDLRFPVWSRQQLQEPLEPSTTGLASLPPGATPGTLEPEYDLLVYVANWPERRNHAWKTLLQARAIENQAYVVGVNRVGKDGNNIYHSGDSMVVDPLGEVLYHAPKEESIFTCTLQPEKLEEVRTRFPFWQDADQFTIEP